MSCWPSWPRYRPPSCRRDRHPGGAGAGASAGVAIVAAIASRLDPERIEISRSGIRAGLLLEALTEEAATPDDVAGRMPAQLYSGRTKTPARRPVNGNGPRWVSRETMSALIGERWRTSWQRSQLHSRARISKVSTTCELHRVACERRWISRRLHFPESGTRRCIGPRRRSLVRWAKCEIGTCCWRRSVKTEHCAAGGAPEDRPADRSRRTRARGPRAEMERYLRQLLDGPLQGELERRFGASGVPSSGTGAQTGHTS